MFKEKTKNNTVRFHSVDQNPLLNASSKGTVYLTSDSYEEAIVVDVILNEEHPEYSSDGYNVGVIKFRLLNEEWFKDDQDLNYAFPLNANILDYPLLSEIVLIFKALNRFYYTTKLNVSNLVTYQSLEVVENDTKSNSSTSTSQDYYQSQGTSKKVTSPTAQDTLGKYFKNVTTVNRLRHQEGDITIEGRSGHSIRFGMNKDLNQSPNLLMRVGPDPNANKTVNTQLGLVVEDINQDQSSLWMVTNQSVPIKLSTTGNKVHFKSVKNAPTQFDGNQIILNTDRLLINTKQDKVFINSFNGIHLTSLQDITSDSNASVIMFATQNVSAQAGQDYIVLTDRDTNITAKRDINAVSSRDVIIKASEKVSVISPKIYMGSANNQSEPLVLGEQLRQLLIEIIDAHLLNAAAYVMTPTGVGQLMTSVQSRLTSIKSELEQGKNTRILSLDNFVNRQNES